MDLQMKKSEQLKELNNFLRDFIEGENYLQNPPMETAKFIEFCKKQGVQTSKEELEYFEKEELLFPIIRVERPVVEEERIKVKKEDGREVCRIAESGAQNKVKFYSSYDFSEHNRDLFLNWFREGNLFDPATREFQSWNNFLGERLKNGNQKIVSFYSGFQIYWLERLKESFSITLNLAGDEIKVSSSIVLTDNRGGPGMFSLAKIDDFSERLKEVAQKEPFKKIFDLEKKKEKLKEDYKKFDKFLKFLLSVQSVYFPYAKSGGGKIHITRGIADDVKKWHKAKRNFKLEIVLNKVNLKIEDVANWYKIFSDEARKILSIRQDDWVWLWKNIAWSKKDELNGSIRRGVEYLQWAVMLKRIIEEHLQKEIVDIDEISNIAADDILKFDIVEMNQYRKRYADSKKNYYHDRYKRLFYLANDFGLDYQPRVMVFVEGETEEKVFPEIFELYRRKKPEDLGVEFVNIQGISRFFGQEISIKNSSGKYQRGFISNFNHLVSYNLRKWQTIPFFIGDSEGDIFSLLSKEVSISFNQNQYLFPKDWQYIWGIANDGKPFQGKDFEMANFSDDEIADVLTVVLNKPIMTSTVQAKRNNGNGIKQIDENVELHKIEIAEKLHQNLFEKYDESVFERPVFKVIDKIENLAVLNHPPVDTEIELKNKEIIEKTLKNNLALSAAVAQ